MSRSWSRPSPSLRASPPLALTVTVGSATTLNWSTLDATSLAIDQGVGTVTGTSAAVTVSSLGTTTYTLTATDVGGSVTTTTSILAVAAPVASSLAAAAATVP